MRIFKSEDGITWTARLHHGAAGATGSEGRIGWEIVEFDTTPSGSKQRIAYRPSGWLQNATIGELIEALREGDAVRATWRTEE